MRNINWIGNFLSVLISRISRKMQKIAFDATNCDINGVALERLWATPLWNGDFILENSPFNVYGISYKDEVKTIFQGGELFFNGIARRGGHSTIRIRLKVGEEHSVFMKYWPELEKLGCSVESSSAESRRLYVLDIPPSANIDNVLKLVDETERIGYWQYEEAYIYKDIIPGRE